MDRKKIYRRTQVYLTERQHTTLDKESQKTNVTKSELIRRIIDRHYEDQLVKK